MEDNNIRIIEMSEFMNLPSNIINVPDVQFNINQPSTSNAASQYLILDDSYNHTKELNNDVTEYEMVPQINQINEDETLKLLTEWRLPQLFTTMQRNEIDLEALMGMQKDQTEELLDGQSLGIKIKFMKKLMDWQRLQNMPISPTNAGICSCSKAYNHQTTSINPIASTSDDRKITSTSSEKILLKHILQVTSQGKSLLTFSENNVNLTDSQRSTLIDQIVSYYINNSIPMGVNDCEAMASQIECRFQNECASVFFQRRTNLKSKGQLYDRYNNRISKLRSAALMPKPKRFKRSAHLIELEINSDVSNTLNQNEAKILCETLKYNRDDNNLDDIFNKWIASANYRLKFINSIQEKSIDSIINEWPAYSQTYGPKLIDIDYNQLYPQSENIYIKFDRFCCDIVPIMEEKIVEPLAKQMFKEFKQQRCVTPDARACVILLLLHAIIKPSTKKRGKLKQQVKFTIKDAQNSFMVLVSSAQEAENFIMNQMQMSSTNELRLQPFIFMIGENLYSQNKFYIYCDKIRYKCMSPLAALDCTFKLFQIFNLEYPIQSKAVWQFIQTFFYNITTKHDDAFPAVDLLISKLKKH